MTPNTGGARLVQAADYDMVRKLAFSLSLLAIFMRFSYFHEALSILVGIKYVMLALMPIAMLTAFMSGALRQTLSSKIGVSFFLYLVWLLPCIVFSSWQGGSFTYVKEYAAYQFPFLILVGGVLVNRSELRKFMYTGALATFVLLIDSRLLGEFDAGGRLTMKGGIGNSNDFAALLLFLFPFLGYACADKKLPSILRIGAGFGVGFAMFLILSTASRGALISLLVVGTIIFFRVSIVQRFIFALVFPPLLIISLGLLAPSTLARVTSIFDSSAASRDAEAVKEAEASSSIRRYLIQRSLEFTVTKPLFGVGPGQFASYEGSTGSLFLGTRGAYNQTHNTLTQVSSESGIPALLCILVSVGTALLTLNRVYSEARKNKESEEMATMSFFLLLSVCGLLTATQFLSLAQLFHYPAIAGIGLAVSRVWKREKAEKLQREQQQQPLPGGPFTPQPVVQPVKLPVPQRLRTKLTR